MPFGIGPGELIIVLIIALLVIGPGKLPDVGAALGKSIREFRKASSDVEEATRIDTAPTPPASTAQAAPPPVSAAPEPNAPVVPPAPNAPVAPPEPNVLRTPSAPPASDSTGEQTR
ncbi:MAG TPA: twin-arginine translocase TatA/TatE family subunit [Methylomirabilota bacterium]|jgi:sec-independent protein translocase protein TatA|nr:twin-arginine translocase TatA/TatE family subunit [Methylomirabilota bacterium]